MKRFFINFLQVALKPVLNLLYKNRLPKFSEDFKGKRVFMISELPGGEKQWTGQRRRKANLGNTHPWNRYFNKPLTDLQQFVFYFLVNYSVMSTLICRIENDIILHNQPWRFENEEIYGDFDQRRT
ncbi:MAG: hypothetical protein GY699_04755 [Desulfobacteraceae bacterium]|nr:hypothetical protein [Desulfobacteraceae bacterium]